MLLYIERTRDVADADLNIIKKGRDIDSELNKNNIKLAHYHLSIVILLTVQGSLFNNHFNNTRRCYGQRFHIPSGARIVRPFI